MKLSVIIPTHSVKGNSEFFTRLLESLWNQTEQDFEIVVSDNSDDNVIKDICEYYKTGIEYEWNPKKGMAINTNHAIQRAKGELIKVLFMDDFLLHDKVLEEIVKKFDKKHEWLMCGSDNNPTPIWTEDILKGNNKLGSPSALTMRRETALLFDEKMSWCLDIDLYHRYNEIYGSPIIMPGKHIGIGVGSHQTTYLMTGEEKQREHDYIMKKYK